MASNAIVPMERGILPSHGDWETMLSMAEVLVKSGLLPAHIKTPQAAVAVIQKGKELGIQPMYALSNIAVIQGKPTANAELMLALIYRDHGDSAVRFVTSDNHACHISYARRNWTTRADYTFTLDDAKQAGLLGNQTWQKYPAAMLRARCISAVARMAFPDSIGGMYLPEEMGADIDEDGAAIMPPEREVRPASRPVEQPVRATTLSSPRTTAGKASTTQIKRLMAARAEAGWTEEDLYGVIAGNYPEAVRDGKPSVRELTSEQIDALIYIVETPIEEEDEPLTHEGHIRAIAHEQPYDGPIRDDEIVIEQPALVDGGR